MIDSSTSSVLEGLYDNISAAVVFQSCVWLYVNHTFSLSIEPPHIKTQQSTVHSHYTNTGWLAEANCESFQLRLNSAADLI